MSEAKNYTIDILGDQYSVVSDESSEHIAQTAAYIHALLQDILAHDATMDHKKAVVLTALRIASKLIHVEQEHQMLHLKGQQLVHTLDDFLCST